MPYLLHGVPLLDLNSWLDVAEYIPNSQEKSPFDIGSTVWWEKSRFIDFGSNTFFYDKIGLLWFEYFFTSCQSSFSSSYSSPCKHKHPGWTFEAKDLYIH